MDICFIQDMWGKAMHMHRAADLVSGEPVWLKKVDLCNGFSCITAIKSVA